MFENSEECSGTDYAAYADGQSGLVIVGQIVLLSFQNEPAEKLKLEQIVEDLSVHYTHKMIMTTHSL